MQSGAHVGEIIVAKERVRGSIGSVTNLHDVTVSTAPEAHQPQVALTLLYHLLAACEAESLAFGGEREELRFVRLWLTTEGAERRQEQADILPLGKSQAEKETSYPETVCRLSITHCGHLYEVLQWRTVLPSAEGL